MTIIKNILKNCSPGGVSMGDDDRKVAEKAMRSQDSHDQGRGLRRPDARLGAYAMFLTAAFIAAANVLAFISDRALNDLICPHRAAIGCDILYVARLFWLFIILSLSILAILLTTCIGIFLTAASLFKKRDPRLIVLSVLGLAFLALGALMLITGQYWRLEDSSPVTLLFNAGSGVYFLAALVLPGWWFLRTRKGAIEAEE